MNTPCFQPATAPRAARWWRGGRRTRSRRPARRPGPPRCPRWCGHWAAATVKREFGWAAGLSEAGVQSLPCQSMRCCGRLGREALPPDVAVVGQGDVREDGVALEGLHGGRVGVVPVPGATPKKPASGLMARSVPSGPGRIHTMSSPRVSTFQPGMVGAASRGSSCRTRSGTRRPGGMALLGRGDADEQHVLGEPALVARHRRGDPQREALLAEQGVAAVAGAVRPDLAGLGELHDVLRVAARPGRHVGHAVGERAAHRVHGGHPLLAGVDEAGDASPTRVMTSMETTTYGESVISMPTCEMGPPTGPIENGTTYMVRPFIEPSKTPLSSARISAGPASCSWGRRPPRPSSR